MMQNILDERGEQTLWECVKKLRELGVPDSAILTLVCFMDLDTLRKFITVVEAEVTKN